MQRLQVSAWCFLQCRPQLPAHAVVFYVVCNLLSGNDCVAVSLTAAQAAPPPVVDDEESAVGSLAAPHTPRSTTVAEAEASDLGSEQPNLAEQYDAITAADGATISGDTHSTQAQGEQASPAGVEAEDIVSHKTQHEDVLRSHGGAPSPTVDAEQSALGSTAAPATPPSATMAKADSIDLGIEQPELAMQCDAAAAAHDADISAATHSTQAQGEQAGTEGVETEHSVSHRNQHKDELRSHGGVPSPTFDAEHSAVGSSAAPHAPPSMMTVAEAETTDLGSKEPEVALQCDAATAADGATISGGTHSMQAEGGQAIPAAVTADQSVSLQHEAGCAVQAEDVVEQQLPAAGSNPEPDMSLLLPGHAIAGGTKHPAGTVAANEAPSAAPADAEAEPAPAAAPCLDSPPAVKDPWALSQAALPVPTPEEQQELLRAFVVEQLGSADRGGVEDTPWLSSLRLTSG